MFASGAWVAGNEMALLLQKNGSGHAFLARDVIDANITAYKGISGSTVVYLAANDYIYISLNHNRSAGSINLHTDSNFNWLCVIRLQ